MILSLPSFRASQLALPILLALPVAMTGAGTALAGGAEGNGPVVIELYTSQGCNACPPADAFLTELARRDDVLPLALHVDYWDYIGWADTFGSPAFTQRQKAYARAIGERSIYTPQMVIEGSDHVVGYRPVEVAQLIDAHAGRADPATVVLVRHGDMLSIRLAPSSGPVGAALVQLVRYLPRQQVQIERGENSGKLIDYVNIVTRWDQVADWDGTGPLGLELAIEGDEAVAIVVQSAGPGAVLGAAALD